MIIDFHTHCYPDQLALKCVPMMEKLSGFPAAGPGTLDGLKAGMLRDGIDYSVILPVATKPTQVEKMNDIAFSQNREKGLFSFGAMHPDYENRRAEFRRIRENGLAGIKLHCEYYRRYIDSEEIVGLIRDAYEEGLMVLIHAGWDPASPDETYTTVDRISHMLDLVGSGTMILAHYGGLRAPEEVLRKICGRDVYLDTSTGYAFSDPEKLEPILNSHDPDRLLFASDTPWFRPKESLAVLKSMGLDDSLLSKILYQNAARLLGLTEEALVSGSIQNS